jgi:hypothetical protein
LRLLGVRAGALTAADEVAAADDTAQGELPLF